MVGFGLRGLLIFSVLLIAACGFRPLYGETASGASGAAELARIQLNTRNDRADALVRGHLRDLMATGSTGAPPKYELVVRIDERAEPVAIEADTTITRFNLRLSARIQLKDLATGAVIHTDAARSITAYNVVDSQFATLAAERNAEDRAALDLAEDIKLRLALFFDRQINPGRLDPRDATSVGDTS
ncbi:MAG: LPS assembly lipoprotein LptE [Alphaproteobacteria bacterium]